METRWIQDFVTLTEVRNFTRAAELRNVSQAAFSRRIQALEQWLGTPLVDRTCFPLRITEAGERFRPAAMALLSQIADARAETAGEQAGNNLRIALPFALASTRLAQWWSQWTTGLDITATVSTGNVLDTLQSLSEGVVDMVICYHHASNPVAPDLSRHDKLVLGTEPVRPYARRQPNDDQPLHQLPGDASYPVPLLMYSPSVYFARVVETAIENAGTTLHGTRIVESAMTDVLASMAQQGLGIAWLPDSSFVDGRYADLVPVSPGQWGVEVDIVAYRLRSNSRRLLDTVWGRMHDKLRTDAGTH